MKTQISILVKNESFYSRTKTFFGIFNMFKKMSVNVWFDDPKGEPIVLKANDQPYVFNVSPGYHAIFVKDPRAKSKGFGNAAFGAMMGGAMSMAAGGSGLAGAMAGASVTGRGSVKDGILECNLNEGDILRISVKPNSDGKVKIRILK